MGHFLGSDNLAKLPTSAKNSSKRRISSTMIRSFSTLLGEPLAGSLQNLTGHPTDNHQGVFDLVADMGRHLAQGREALRLQELFLQLLALSQVPEKPHRGYLLIVAINKTGRKFDGNLLSGFAQPHGLIMDQAPGPPYSGPSIFALTSWATPGG